MAKIDLDSPELFINRELSWLEFNDRVLRNGMSADVPLLERLKFLAIVSSNLDEFFMIRVASIKQQKAAGIKAKDFAGMSPADQLGAIAKRVGRMVREQSNAVTEVLKGLDENGLHLISTAQASIEQQRFLESYFQGEILPSLTPLAVENLEPCPILPGLRLNVALLLEPNDGGQAAPRRFAVVPVPAGLPRFISMLAEKGLYLVAIEDVIIYFVSQLFPGYSAKATTVFRLTRDADVSVEEDDAADLLAAMQQAVYDRKRRTVVRLEVASGSDERLMKLLTKFSQVKTSDIYEIDGLLDAAAMMEIATRAGFDNLKYPNWPPQAPRDLLGQEDLWQALQDRDVMLLHPYESFDPVIRLVEQAADDPNVLAIKQTLYRTSGDSPIVRALARAAENGKQVTVLVELKARFDEAKNVTWARRLEDAGCYVIYGIAGFKTHAKMLLVVRREAHRVRRYVHLSTGNYNDRTARLYSDIAIMSSDADLASDAAAFFNLLTGYSQPVGWKKCVIAPTGLRERFIELIEREIQVSTKENPGLIIAKLNSLQDKEIIQALYRASQSGVKIQLNVRGICCLRPGVAGVSENIEVISIVDRYLEHSRIFYFRNGGHEEVYLSSADWMVRNLDKRLEVLFPITQKDLQRRLISLLGTFMSDNVKARRLLPGGEYQPVKQRKGPAIRAQEQLYLAARQAAGAQQPIVEFRPLARPAE